MCSKKILFPIRVIGIGTNQKEDVLGIEIIDLLKKQKDIKKYLRKTLSLITCHHPMINLLDLMRGAQTVFLIDAIRSHFSTGTIYRLQNQMIETQHIPISTHGIHLAQILQLGRELKMLPDQVIFYGIDIGSENQKFPINLYTSFRIWRAKCRLMKRLIDDIIKEKLFESSEKG